VEHGFECNSNVNSPDICIDILPPTASLKVIEQNLLRIVFSEVVKAKVSSDVLEKMIEITLKKKCDISWKLKENFPKDTTFTELLIEITPECPLKMLVFDKIFFKNLKFITDLSDNALATEAIRVKTQKYTHEEADFAAKTAGEIINILTIITLIFMLGLTSFQISAVGSLWHFINMIQILSYIPLLNCNIPSNYMLLLTDYLTAKKLAIPLDLIPDSPLNPFSYLSEFMTEPLNERFAEFDYESTSFIFNFAEELSTWLLLGLLYLLLIISAWLFPKFGYFYHKG